MIKCNFACLEATAALTFALSPSELVEVLGFGYWETKTLAVKRYEYATTNLQSCAHILHTELVDRVTAEIQTALIASIVLMANSADRNM